MTYITLGIKENITIKVPKKWGVDIHLDAEGKPQIMKITSLPGLSPAYSNNCIQIVAAGNEHEDLILEG